LKDAAFDGIVQELRLAASAVRRSSLSVRKPELEPHAAFAAVLKGALDQVNSTQHRAAELARRFQTGSDDIPVHEVMLALQKANISLQATVQVRNRIVQAYHDIMNMPV